MSCVSTRRPRAHCGKCLNEQRGAGWRMTQTGDAKLRLAVVGVGLIGRRHIQLVREHPKCRLVAIADPSPAARQLAQEPDVALFESLADLLANERPDGVILATPNGLHPPQCVACIDAGTAVLVEKPIADTYRAAQRICDAIAGTDARVLVGHHRVHSPILRRAREIVQSGALGDVVAVSGSAMFYKPDSYFADAPWRTQAGGGPILINFIHDVGNLRALCGEITAVQAFGSNRLRGHHVEDTAVINLRFANGTLGSFVVSDTAVSGNSWEQASGENRAYAHKADDDCYHVTGTYGSLAIPTMRLLRYPDGAPRSWYEPFETQVVGVVRKDPLRLQLDHFCEVVRGEVRPLVSASDGLKNLQVTEAVLESAATGRVIDIPDN